MRSRTADLFGAIADPTRRSILDLLRERDTATAGEIAASFSHASRPAISKHLKVLRRAGLVEVDERGREWHYRLDPEPLGEIYDGWLARPTGSKASSGSSAKSRQRNDDNRGGH